MIPKWSSLPRPLCWCPALSVPIHSLPYQSIVNDYHVIPYKGNCTRRHISSIQAMRGLFYIIFSKKIPEAARVLPFLVYDPKITPLHLPKSFQKFPKIKNLNMIWICRTRITTAFQPLQNFQFFALFSLKNAKNAQISRFLGIFSYSNHIHLFYHPILTLIIPPKSSYIKAFSVFVPYFQPHFYIQIIFKLYSSPKIKKIHNPISRLCITSPPAYSISPSKLPYHTSLSPR